jgi:hypothetical protein
MDLSRHHQEKRDLSNGNTNRHVSKVYGVSTDKFYLDVTVKQGHIYCYS